MTRSWSKISKVAFIANARGSALYIVLVFSFVITTTASIYFMSHMRSSRFTRNEPIKIQALANARSGAIFGLGLIEKDRIMKHSETDSTKKTDSAFIVQQLEAAFTSDLFRDDDSAAIDLSSLELTPEDTLGPLCLFDSTRFGFCKLVLHETPLYRILLSFGSFKTKEYCVTLLLAAQPFSYQDTVIFLDTVRQLDEIGFIDGQVCYISELDSLSNKKRFFIDETKLTELFNTHRQTLKSLIDSGIPEMLKHIQYQDDFNQLHDTIRSDLIIDGQYRDLKCTDKRTIYVTNSLQIMAGIGDVTLENLTFIVGGDAKVYTNKVMCKNVTIITLSRFFCEDAIFEGTVLSQSSINIYKQAEVLGKSCFISLGTSSASLTPGAPDSTQTPGPPPSPSSKNSTQKPYSLSIEDQAKVDGVLISINKQSGIYTGPETHITGILWSLSRVCHEGMLQGVIKTSLLVDNQQPFSRTKDIITGEVKPLQSIAEYYTPYYCGQQKILQWLE